MIERPPMVVMARKPGAVSNEVDLELEISPELAVFQGHFEGTPLLAGVVQVDWAIACGREHFKLPAMFRALSALKFTRVVRPGDRLLLHLRCNEAAGELRFLYSGPAGAFSSGCISFADV